MINRINFSFLKSYPWLGKIFSSFDCRKQLYSALAFVFDANAKFMLEHETNVLLRAFFLVFVYRADA